jgi:hypothetical protein
MAAAFVAAAAHESDGAPQATIVRTEHVQHFFSALLPPLDTVRQASRTERGTCIPTCAAISQLQSDGLALQRHGSYWGKPLQVSQHREAEHRFPDLFYASWRSGQQFGNSLELEAVCVVLESCKRCLGSAAASQGAQNQLPDLRSKSWEVWQFHLSRLFSLGCIFLTGRKSPKWSTRM